MRKAGAVEEGGRTGPGGSCDSPQRASHGRCGVLLARCYAFCRYVIASASCSLSVCGYVACWCRVEMDKPIDARVCCLLAGGPALTHLAKIWLFLVPGMYGVFLVALVGMSVSRGHTDRFCLGFWFLMVVGCPWGTHASAAASWLRRCRDNVVRSYVSWRIWHGSTDVNCIPT